MINTNAYGGNWLHILLKMTGSFGCVVTSKQCCIYFIFQSEKKNGGWVLMIGNVRDSSYAPKIIQSFLPKSEKIRSSPNSTDDPGPKFLSKLLAHNWFIKH